METQAKFFPARVTMTYLCSCGEISTIYPALTENATIPVVCNRCHKQYQVTTTNAPVVPEISVEEVSS